jgi:hypothetical protein
MCTPPIAEPSRVFITMTKGKYCDAGTRVRYVKYEGKDHGQTLFQGMYSAWTWISARFNGVPVWNCSKKTVTGDNSDDEEGLAAPELDGSIGLEEQYGQDRLASPGFPYEKGDL